MAKPPTDPPPSGPWSDLPPPEPPPRLVRAARRWREPMIRNWRGLVIVFFLLLAAPLFASWLSRVILGFFPGGG